MKYLLPFILIIIGSCSIQSRKSIFFEKFDLFKLYGENVIPVKKRNKFKQYISISAAQARSPNKITYYFPKRRVVLNLDTNFRASSSMVYVYTTGNLLGGKTGKQRVYSLHYIENMYKLYISFSDTLFVKSYDAIDARFSNRYHYLVSVYIKRGEKFETFSLLQEDTNYDDNDYKLYCKWRKVLKSFKPQSTAKLSSFPPY